MSSDDVVLGLDFSDIEHQLEETEDKVARSRLAMATAIRQTAQAGILVLQVAGAGIDQIFMLYIESLLVGIEVSLAVSAGTFGLTQAFQIGQIAAMIVQIRQIKQKRASAAASTGAAVQLLRMGTFR